MKINLDKIKYKLWGWKESLKSKIEKSKYYFSVRRIYKQYLKRGVELNKEFILYLLMADYFDIFEKLLNKIYDGGGYSLRGAFRTDEVGGMFHLIFALIFITDKDEIMDRIVSGVKSLSGIRIGEYSVGAISDITSSAVMVDNRRIVLKGVNIFLFREENQGEWKL